MEKYSRIALIPDKNDGDLNVVVQHDLYRPQLQSGMLEQFTVTDGDMLRDYWRKRKQPWRTEQEITIQRQIELGRLSTTVPNLEQDRYPFKGIKLSRADVEWLVAFQASGQGSVEQTLGVRREANQTLDLRGADLSKVRLVDLPLERMRGGLNFEVWALATDEQREAGAVRMEKSDLRGTYLDGAVLCGAHLEGADLSGAHLEGADLSGAHLEGADLSGAHLEGADLSGAHLEGNERFPKPTNLRMVYFDDTTILEGVNLGDRHYGTVPVADVRWGNANLTAVDWTEVAKLGDEYETQWKMPVEYQGAIRANRQLATALRTQGLNDAADHYAYRAHINQKRMRLQQALLPIVMRVFVRERMPLPKVLLRLEECRHGQRMPQHPVTLALVRVLSLLLVLVLVALAQPLVLVILCAACVVAFLTVLPVLRKRRQHAPQYRRAQQELPPPGLLLQSERRKQQWLLLLGFVLGTPKSQRSLLMKAPTVALEQVPFAQRLLVRSRGNALSTTIILSLLLLLLLFDDTVVCYGRYILSVMNDLLTGYGYRPMRSLFWLLAIVLGFTALYIVYGHYPAPGAFAFSLGALLGRGFSQGHASGLGNLTARLSEIELGLGLVIGFTCVASWIRRLSER
jgi:uncharacterized protein YjbI with pentapeptide repeats